MVGAMDAETLKEELKNDTKVKVRGLDAVFRM